MNKNIYDNEAPDENTGGFSQVYCFSNATAQALYSAVNVTGS